MYPSMLIPTSKGRSSSKSSPIKTRRLQKSKQRDISRCTICKNSKGDLDACTRCRKLYHLSKCILYPPAMVVRVNQVNWLCPKCIRCSLCKLMIDDPTNVECSNCLQAWHGSCKPVEGRVSNRQWFCNVCLEKSNFVELLDGFESSKQKELFALFSVKRQPNGENCENASGRKYSSIVSAGPQCIGTACNSNAPYSYIAHSSQMQLPSTGNNPMCLSSVVPEIFAKALENTDIYRRNKNTSKFDGQWVNFGGNSDIKVLYNSPYPDYIKDVPLFFVCAFCLRAFNDQCLFIVHRDCCTCLTPPGIEIYRDSGSALSFFEVDGAQERVIFYTYCRNLCLFAMLFISSKTLHIEVGTFFFYILTKIMDDGCRIVGYFSKEKNPSRNNNLSCLLTIPSEQRNGYGHLLIDMSYKLSEIERKVGSPEHPLSDFGLYTYRKYWKSSILCYLRSIYDSSNVSIKSISLHTRIHPTDIVNELLRNNLLVMKDGNYFIKTWKLAYKLPLSTLRRRVVDSSLIRWEPKFDVTKLDVFKLNHYA
ncbi:MOZ/SAS family protein [Dictyocaulus viviparus]|uniref:Histone acetyltransferase n=1 Tax=Dictyocaulus viviparus TaxID=29172 RepID=A0A0D8XSZ8_DICVI|nr:MOZ/SAS family protein [Dictyocaulus viviparus]